MKNYNIPKTYIFIVLSTISALSYSISNILFIVMSAVTVILSFKKPLNFIMALIIISLNLIISSFFIVTDTAEYKTNKILYSGSSKIYVDKDYDIKAGDIIFGSFEIDKERTKPFFKPVYKTNKPITVINMPVISSILEYRTKVSDEIFYLSGGKIYTAQALILGDKKYIPEDLKDAYTISGLFHLLSMSGSHVAILTAICLSALFFLPLKIRFAFASAAALFLIILGGFNVTVIRASLFASIIMTAYIFDVKVNSKRFIFFIAGLFMLISPQSAYDISFLMSFGAVFGIIYLLNSGYGWFKTAIITGIAATLITAPLSMYVFGMTNHLSILSTMIMAPVIYLHILFAIFALFSIDLISAPLYVIEHLSNSLVFKLADFTYFAFILKNIPLWVLILSILTAVIPLFLSGRKKYISLLSLLVIFYPAPNPPDIIFPNLKGANKGFIVYNENNREIFYQGSIYGFKYTFMPILAKYGHKTFDYGQIKIFGGKNNYIKIKNIGTNFKEICLNYVNDDCKYFYHTKSNSVKKNDIKEDLTHIVWKNKFQDKSILEISKTGQIIVDKNKITIENKQK